MREDAATKGRRYLTEGRLIVTHLHGTTVRAECRGDGTTYTLGYTADHGWFCDCKALGRCAHLIALGLVVNVSPLRRGQT